MGKSGSLSFDSGICIKLEIEARNELELLPLGLAEGATLLRNVAKDEVLAYDDVRLPLGRLSDELRVEQDARFAAVLDPHTAALA